MSENLHERLYEAIDTNPLDVIGIVEAALAAKDAEIEALKAGINSIAGDAMEHRFCVMKMHGAARRAEQAEAERDANGQRADRLEAALRHLAAQAHRRKWAHQATHPYKDSPAFEELHRLGNDILDALKPGIAQGALDTELSRRTAQVRRYAGTVNTLADRALQAEKEGHRLRLAWKSAQQGRRSSRVLNREMERLVKYWRLRTQQAEATTNRARRALADALDCQKTADPSERMRCAMCCNDHFDDLAAALALPADWPKLLVPKYPPRNPSEATHALHDEPDDLQNDEQIAEGSTP